MTNDFQSVWDMFNEAVRVEPVSPTKDTPERKKLREPGDVGKVERLTQMDKDLPDTTVQMNTAARLSQGYDRMKGKRKNEPDVPLTRTVKRDYSKRDQYGDRVLGGGKLEPEEAEMDPKFDPDSPKYQRSKNQDVAARMAAAYKPGMDRVSQADRVMDDAIKDAQTPTARQPIRLSDGEIADTAYLRHGYQPSGVGLNRRLGQDDLDYIFNAGQDPNPISKANIKKTGVMDKGGVEQTRQQKPTARDLEMHSAAAEKKGAEQFDRKYLTRDVQRFQQKFRDALDGQDSKAVQSLAFKHDVTDRMLDKFISMHGFNRAAKKGMAPSAAIMKDLETAGIGGDRETAVYGGDLGTPGEKYRNEDGTYDLTSMPKDLRSQALYNRAREMVRTYLSQGGRDAYAPHEGLRSIGDMDLEHIRSLTQGGKDDPSNWVFASGELNKLRGNRDLTKAVEPFAEGPRGTDQSRQKSAFDDFTAGDSKLVSQLEKEFGGKFAASGAGRGIFSASGYNKLTDKELNKLRARAKDLGMSRSQVNDLFPPQNIPDKDTPYKVGGTLGDEGKRIKGMPYAYDRDEYDTDVTTDARDQIFYNNLMSKLKTKYGNLKFSQLEQTPEGKLGMDQIRDMNRSTSGRSKFSARPKSSSETISVTVDDEI